MENEVAEQVEENTSILSKDNQIEESVISLFKTLNLDDSNELTWFFWNFQERMRNILSIYL